MHEKVKEFIDKKKEEQERLKQKHLNELGLFDTEDATSSDYDILKYEDNVAKYYKKVPIEVTDEEYEQILKASKQDNNIGGNNNTAVALTVIAWIVYAAGFIAGIAQETEFSFAIALTYWSAALIGGTMFLGFAEIIKLLQKIVNK